MREKPIKQKRRLGLKILAALLIVCAALLMLGKYGLTVSRYEIASDALPGGFDGFRIVQLSDLHGSVFGKDNERLLKKVEAETPDIIVMTGDFLDEGRTDGELPELKKLAEGLMKIAPVYFVSGNHDWASGAISELADMLDGTGVEYLRNEYVTIEKNGAAIVLGGVEDPNGWAGQETPEALAERMNAEGPESFIVLLAHRNYWITDYPDLPVDLILCGHEHGGIVRLPGLGGIIGNSRPFLPLYEDGVFESGRYHMAVSRGLGNSVPLPRFCNTPEIVSLTLKSKS